MATRTVQTVDIDQVLVQTETWSNGTQPADPPAGYVVTGPDGAVLAERDLTDDEAADLAGQDAADADTRDRDGLLDAARAALTANAAYLGLAKPTAAQQATQIAALTRQATGLIHLVIRLLDKEDTT